MLSKKQIDMLDDLAESVKGWGSCNQSWLFDEDDGYQTFAVGAVQDGEKYSVALVDCDKYESNDGANLAAFYSAANPQAVRELIAMLREAQKDADKWRDYVANRNKCYDRENAAVITIEGLSASGELMATRHVVSRMLYETSSANEILRSAEYAANVFDAQLIAIEGMQRHKAG